MPMRAEPRSRISHSLVAALSMVLAGAGLSSCATEEEAQVADRPGGLPWTTPERIDGSARTGRPAIRLLQAGGGSASGSASAAQTGELPLTAEWATGESKGFYRGMAADAQGNVYGAGDEYVSGDENRSWEACVMAKYTSAGKLAWSRKATAHETGSHFETVAVDRFGNIYAVGTMSGWGAVDFGNRAGVEGLGAPQPESPSQRSIIVKYDSGGRAQWARAGRACDFSAISFTRH